MAPRRVVEMQVVCGHCGWVLEVDGDRAGEVLPCPRCGQDVRIPGAGPGDGDGEGDSAAGFADQARAAIRRSPRARVTCPRCGHTFTVGLRMCGKAVRCPSCRVSVRIPYPESPPGPVAGSPRKPPAVAKPTPEAAAPEQQAPRAGRRWYRLRYRRGWVLVLVPALVLAVVGLAVLLKHLRS